MGSERKNISFDPAGGSISNTSLTGPEAECLRGMLRRFGDGAERLVRDLLPAMRSRWNGRVPAFVRPRSPDATIRRGTTIGCCMSMHFPAGR